MTETATAYLDLSVDDCTAGVVGYDLNPDTGIAWNHELILAVISQYGPKLRIYLSGYLRTPADIDDMMQELYIRLMNYREISDIESIKAFVFTIASNLLKDRARRSYTRAAKCSTSIDGIDIPVEVANPEKILEDQDELEHMYHIIGRLQPNCRKALLLHRDEGLSYKEIALCMGVTVSMVEKHIMEALRELRLALPQYARPSH